jgi:hypothetical protein
VFISKNVVWHAFSFALVGVDVTALMSLTQVATKGKGLRARRENKQVGKA